MNTMSMKMLRPLVVVEVPIDRDMVEVKDMYEEAGTRVCEAMEDGVGTVEAEDLAVVDGVELGARERCW